MPKVKAELEAALQDFGARPYGFFSILDDSDNPTSTCASRTPTGTS